jgi:hypothetical protein
VENIGKHNPDPPIFGRWNTLKKHNHHPLTAEMNWRHATHCFSIKDLNQYRTFFLTCPDISKYVQLQINPKYKNTVELGIIPQVHDASDSITDFSAIDSLTNIQTVEEELITVNMDKKFTTMMTTVCGFTMDFNTLQHDQIYASP